jgi:hypothetical protein
MNQINRGIASAALLLLAAGSALGQADPNKSYDIKAKYSVGDLLKYKMQMDMDMKLTAASGTSPFPGGKMEMSSDLKYKTVALRPEGGAVVVIQTENAKGTMAGNPLPVPQTPPVTMEIDSRGVGKVRGAENLPGGAGLAQVMNMNRMPAMGIVLPDHPVKVGDSWSTETPSPMGKIKIECSLLGTEPIGGAETLRIKMVTTVPLDMKIGQNGPVTEAEKAMMVMTGNIVSNNIANILADNARIVKMAGDMMASMKMEMKGEAASQSPFGSEMNMKMDGKVLMNLVSAGKAPATAPAPSAPAKKAVSKKK